MMSGRGDKFFLVFVNYGVIILFVYHDLNTTRLSGV